jgi:hypothetical protein
LDNSQKEAAPNEKFNKQFLQFDLNAGDPSLDRHGV